MRLFSCIAFALFLAAPLAWGLSPPSPEFAGRPDRSNRRRPRRHPGAALGQIRRMPVRQGRASKAPSSECYFGSPKTVSSRVDDHGLNDRAKSVMEEIGKADEYGLRPADYPLPKATDGNPDVKWLADAEIKISFAVLGYARDARGGRIDSSEGKPQSRSGSHAARSARGARVVRLFARPRFLLAELPARPGPVRGPAPSL